MEGEVLLFYKYRKYPRYRETTEIIVQMQEAFAEKLSELNECMGINIEMSLRFIVHYGDFFCP
ncbi:hypothetical protein [Sphingobacterium daejeonense]|uniref:hypothetical protein n=1 Tax=Sphingobacterium daejeonense TaxID=371142 RepID=UPI0037426F96